MPTLSCLVAPPCTLVLLIVCKRRSLPWLPPPSRSRSLLLLKGNTLSGLEDPSWLLSPPSNRCGSPNRSTMSPAPPSSTGSASKPPIPSRPPTSSPPPSPPPTSAFLNYLTHKTNIPWNILHFWTSFLFLINRVFIQILIFSNGRNKNFPDFVSQIFFFLSPSSHQKLHLILNQNEHKKRRDYLAS